ncbi:MAG: hypothetical protein U0793_11720 [Gemmataceae bacterium]
MLASRRAKHSARSPCGAHRVVSAEVVERRLPCQDDGQDRAQAEDVRAGVHLADGADRLPEGMYAGVPSTLPACVCEPSDSRRLTTCVSGMVSSGSPRAGPDGQNLGQPPVHHLYLAEGAHHHVRRLEVPVDDIVSMSVGERLTYLLEGR